MDMDMEGGRGDAPLVLGFAQPPPPLITNLCFPPHGRVAGVVVSQPVAEHIWHAVGSVVAIMSPSLASLFVVTRTKFLVVVSLVIT